MDGRLRFQGANEGPTPRPLALRALPKPAYPSLGVGRLERTLHGAFPSTLLHSYRTVDKLSEYLASLYKEEPEGED